MYPSLVYTHLLNASTIFWIKCLFFPVFSIMVMLKQSSLSAFCLLWKTSSSGFLSLDQVSLHPWISLVTFHWTGDALKASLIHCRVIAAVVLTRPWNSKNISQSLPEMPHQTHSPIAFAFFHGCVALPVSHLATCSHTQSNWGVPGSWQKFLLLVPSIWLGIFYFFFIPFLLHKSQSQLCRWCLLDLHP